MEDDSDISEFVMKWNLNSVLKMEFVYSIAELLDGYSSLVLLRYRRHLEI